MLNIKIQIRGCIDKNWSEWFQGLEITHTTGEDTLLSGSVQDQAELYGLLARLWNLRLALVAVQVEEKPTEPTK